MGAIPVIQKDSRVPVCLSDQRLPLFYMNDYSLLGLLVSDLDLAHQVLADQHLAVERKAGYLEISIDRPGQMPEIVSLLDRNGISSGITDIAGQIYQG